MFRSLAGYIFGGTKDDPSDEPVECDAKEVNDWLVVNVTDRPTNANDLDESVLDYDMDMEVEDGHVPAPECSWVGPKQLLHEERRLLMEEQKAMDNHKKVEDGDGLSPVCSWTGAKDLLLEETGFVVEKQKAVASKNVEESHVLSPTCSWEGLNDKMLNESKFDELSTFPDTQIACPNVFEKGQSQKPLTLPNRKSPCTKILDETPIKGTEQLLWCKQKRPHKKSSKQSMIVNVPFNVTNDFTRKAHNINFVATSTRYETLSSPPSVKIVTDENFPALPVAQVICPSLGGKLTKTVEQLPVQIAQSPKKKCCTRLSYAQVLMGNIETEERSEKKVQLLADVTNELNGIFQAQNEIFYRGMECQDNLEKSLEASIEKMREIHQKRREKKIASCPKSAKRKMTCQSVYAEANMNNHSSVLFNKADILQRIKELEPEQRAMQQVLKKNITRGQLTRHNKTYLYDTSTKRNRRKDLQRNPSGANNNRKC